MRGFWQQELQEFQAGAETSAKIANKLTGRSYPERRERQLKLPASQQAFSCFVTPNPE